MLATRSFLLDDDDDDGVVVAAAWTDRAKRILGKIEGGLRRPRSEKGLIQPSLSSCLGGWMAFEERVLCGCGLRMVLMWLSVSKQGARGHITDSLGFPATLFLSAVLLRALPYTI
jgi:hypothetical protein